MTTKEILLWGAGLAGAGFVLYKLFGSTTAAPLTVAPTAAAPAESAAPSEADLVASSNGNGRHLGLRKRRRAWENDWSPSAKDFLDSDNVKEGDSVQEDHEDEGGDDGVSEMF